MLVEKKQTHFLPDEVGTSFVIAPDLTERQLVINELPELGFSWRILDLQSIISTEGYLFNDTVNNQLEPEIALHFISFYQTFIDPKSLFWKGKEEPLLREELEFVILDREMVSWVRDRFRTTITEAVSFTEEAVWFFENLTWEFYKLDVEMM